MSRRRALLWACLCAAACRERLDEPSIVKTTRVLALVTDPPAAAPGEDVHVDALVVDPAGRALELSWTACAAEGLGQFGRRGGSRGGSPLSDGNAQYGVDTEREGCVGAEDAVALPIDDDGALLPGAVTAALYEDLAVLAATYGEGVDEETLRFIVETSGLPITIGLEVRHDGELLVAAFKRALIRAGEPGQNPPPPRFAMAGRWISGRDGADRFTCVTEDGEPLTVAPDEEVALAPDPDDEPWRETYQVIEITGEVAERTEGAYYSWFSTGGEFDHDDTNAPERDNAWRSPDDPGVLPLWIVVRDGHGGTSACRAEVRVR